MRSGLQLHHPCPKTSSFCVTIGWGSITGGRDKYSATLPVLRCSPFGSIESSNPVRRFGRVGRLFHFKP